MKTKAIKWLNEQITDSTTVEQLNLIKFIKRCVNSFVEEEKEPKEKVDINKYFEVLWKAYPRKINKQLAKRTMEHKLRGLTEEECRDKCYAIWKLEKQYINKLTANGTEENYILHFSSFLNNNVPNSKYYKGR